MTAQVLRLSTCCKAMPKAFQPQTCSRCNKRATFTLQPKPGYEEEPKNDNAHLQTVNRTNHHIGLFATQVEASAARHAAEVKYYGTVCP